MALKSQVREFCPACNGRTATMQPDGFRIHVHPSGCKCPPIPGRPGSPAYATDTSKVEFIVGTPEQMETADQCINRGDVLPHADAITAADIASVLKEQGAEPLCRDELVEIAYDAADRVNDMGAPLSALIVAAVDAVLKEIGYVTGEG